MYVDLGIYIQKLTLPNLRVAGDDKSTTLVGEFPIPGNIVIPDNPTFTMEIVNVEAPVIENVFYPWMRETTLPWWSYEEQPFTTATVTIDFSGHSNAKYVFLGCRPVQIQTMQPDQAPTVSLTRNVTFAFDCMTVLAGETTIDNNDAYRGMPAANQSGGSKSKGGLAGIANSALFSAANTLRL